MVAARLAAHSERDYTFRYKGGAIVAAAYEFDGELYDTVGEFLDALAHAYKSGDKESVVDALEEYGFSLSDIQVRPGGGL